MHNRLFEFLKSSCMLKSSVVELVTSYLLHNPYAILSFYDTMVCWLTVVAIKLSFGFRAFLH